MRKVAENIDLHRVGHCKSVLDSHEIPSMIKNLGASSVMGEVPFSEVFPELWVVNDEDYDRAMEVLQDYLNEEEDSVHKPSPDWVCPKCESEVPGNFGNCWNCDFARDEAK